MSFLRLLCRFKELIGWDFPGSLVVRTQDFHCGGLGSIPGQETKIPQSCTGLPKTKRLYLEQLRRE